MKTDWNTELAEEMYQKGKSPYEIENKVDVCRSTIRKYIKNHTEIKTRNMSEAKRENNLDDKAFSKLNEETKYWIGFLMADGWIKDQDGGSYLIGLSLQAKDRDHVKKFKEFLGSTHKIATEKTNNPNEQDYIRFRVSSNQIANDLSKYGVVPNKSKGTEIKHLKDDRHFWRGMADGDGYISKTNINTKISITGIKNIIKDWKKFCCKRTKTNASIFPTNESFGFKVTGKYAKPILKELYVNQNIALKRKAERAISHITSLDLC